jgi:hypothetical protein
MGDFVSTYSETSHYPPQPATTSTSAFRSAGDSHTQAGTSYANTQIDSQNSNSFINLEKLQQQPSSATASSAFARHNQAMSAYDMQEGQNSNNNNNMSYDPSFSNFDPSLTGYQNDYVSRAELIS